MLERNDNMTGGQSALSSGSQALRPRARILRTLGDELISSETVALIELVKNSYDADASRVLVRFSDDVNQGKGYIVVIDNGHGMGLDTVLSAWMEPATLFKKRERRSPRGRRMLGEKGIGRFAASRLADNLEVVTRKQGSDKEVRALFDWSQFDDEQKYLDEVEALWEETVPTEICPGGAIQELWQANERQDKRTAEELLQGTILRMEGFRIAWTAEHFENLRTGLSRLVSPFLRDPHVHTNEEFLIDLELPAGMDHLSGLVEPSEALQNPPYQIKGEIDANGNYNLLLSLPDGEERKTGTFTMDDGHPPICGPIGIEIRAWDREQEDLTGLAELYGSSLKNIRADLDNAAGINVYRDGFRVLPYGEPRNDWLRLDHRRVQNPTRNLSNNQVVGYVLISADANPALRDQSNREGLMEGRAVDDLRVLVKLVLSVLETRRYALRRALLDSESSSSENRFNRRENTSSWQLLLEDMDFREVQDRITENHPDDAELLELIGEKQQRLAQHAAAFQEVLGRYRRLATLGQLIDTILHDGRTPLAKIINEASHGGRLIQARRQGGEALIERLAQCFDTIRAQAGVLSTVFKKIEPFGGRKRGRPAVLRLEDQIQSAFAVLETEVKEAGIAVELPTGNTQATVDDAEFQQIIINLIQNSIYWLRKVPKDQRRIIVDLSQQEDALEILFSDSGPGIPDEIREQIFHPYFSTKPDGIGLGLTIIGEIIQEYYDGTLDLLDSGPLDGATFRIQLRRRI